MDQQFNWASYFAAVTFSALQLISNHSGNDLSTMGICKDFQAIITILNQYDSKPFHAKDKTIYFIIMVVLDFKFQTGNLSIILQKWSCEV